LIAAVLLAVLVESLLIGAARLVRLTLGAPAASRA
jgi:hypothetical protein